MALERDKIMEGVKGVRVGEGYGLCTRCDNLGIRRSKLDFEEVWCDRYDRPGQMQLRPSKQDNIIECSYFWPKGQMNLREMAGLATIIDVKKKATIGFGKSEEMDVTIKAPDDADGDKDEDWVLD